MTLAYPFRPHFIPEKYMDRRTFIRGAGVVAASAGALAAPAIAQGRTELRLVMPWTVDFPGLASGASRFAARIEAITGGRITIQINGAGQLVPPLEEYAAVADGRADLYHAPDYYYAALHPALNFFTNAPLGMTATEFAAWIAFGEGGDLWTELARGLGVQPLLVGNTGAQMGGWFKAPIASVADLAGRNFRMPGLGGEVWRRLGMNVITLPANEILGALQDGRLDGADWVGPWNDGAIGIEDAATNYYYPSLVEGCGAITLGVNAGVWDALADADKAAFSAAAQAEHDLMLAEYRYQSGIALASLRDAGVTVTAFPEDVLAAIAEIGPEVAAAAATDELGQRIHDSYYAARDTVRGWTEIGEGRYIAARGSALG